jgi:hypothetical protein
MWLNPIERAVAVPWTMVEDPRMGGWQLAACSPSTAAAFVDVTPLRQCSIDPDLGLTTPGMARLAAAIEAHDLKLAQHVAWSAQAAARRAGPEFAGWAPQGPVAVEGTVGPPPGLTAWRRPEPRPLPDVDRSICLTCGKPLPSWQRGGSHILGECAAVTSSAARPAGVDEQMTEQLAKDGSEGLPTIDV